MQAADRPSRRLIMQRVRNGVMTTLDLLASFELQRQLDAVEYAPWEALNTWDDWVVEPGPPDYAPPVFTAGELDAMESVGRAIERVTPDLLDSQPALELVQQQMWWQDLRDTAETARQVFGRRGRLSDDIEIEG